MAEYIRWSALFLAGLAPVFLSKAANAQASTYQPGVTFPIVGIVSGQGVRVNAVNLGMGAPALDSKCDVTLQFLNANAVVLKQKQVSLAPGAATFLDLDRGDLPGEDRRAPVRAVLLFGYSGGPPPAAVIAQAFACNIVPSLEILDTDTGRATVVLTETKPLPSPTTPAQ